MALPSQKQHKILRKKEQFWSLTKFGGKALLIESLQLYKIKSNTPLESFGNMILMATHLSNWTSPPER